MSAPSLKSTRGMVAVAAVFACLLSLSPKALAWYGEQQDAVFREYGNPVANTYARKKTSYLYTLHKDTDRMFMFIFYKGKCIGRVEMKSSFSSGDLAAQLAQYQGDSTWELVQENKEVVDPNPPKNGLFGKKEPSTTPPEQMSEVEVKGWQRKDRRFYAMWIRTNQAGIESQVLALGEKKAANAIIDSMEEIGKMVNDWVAKVKKES